MPRTGKHQGIGSDGFKERIGGQKPDVSTSIPGYQVGACQARVEGGQRGKIDKLDCYPIQGTMADFMDSSQVGSTRRGIQPTMAKKRGSKPSKEDFACLSA